ncbi:MAG: PIG-L family deacetylase [Candidatus Bathyarchaeia archaeon]
MRRYLVFGTHPDDETIGLGGTIKKLADTGHEVTVITFTSGSGGYDKPELKEKIADIRMSELEKVNRFLGVKHYETWRYDDYDDRLTNREVINREIAAIRRYKPDIILTHHIEDRHRDHRAVSQSVQEAWWQAGEKVVAELGPPWRAERLYFFEIFSPIPYPTVIVDISQTFEAKIEALHLYKSQLETLPYVLRAVEGLNMFRGSLIGARYGEALQQSNIVPTAW